MSIHFGIDNIVSRSTIPERSRGIAKVMLDIPIASPSTKGPALHTKAIFHKNNFLGEGSKSMKYFRNPNALSLPKTLS